MQAFSCVSSCSSNYLYDSYDNTCKKARYKYEYPCQPGTYNSYTLQTSSTSCLQCPPGNYCPGLAFVGPIQPCIAGYYCLAGATMGSDDSSAQTTTKYCPAGYYCPSASSNPTACPAGKYCSTTRLTAPSGDCYAGYLCTSAATSPMQALCPAGSYCPAGATAAQPCPPGTYLPSNGASDLSNCLTCPAGFYCGLSGATSTQGSCAAGFYCPAGSTSSTPASNYCPVGYKCPAGSPEPILCDTTDYQSDPMMATCVTCPAGSFCSDQTSATPCPAGNYCPGSNQIVACPAGTYNPAQGKTVSGDCIGCPAGSACETPGLINPTTSCAPGYYCTGSTNTRFPTGTNGNRCNPGYYCPDRSSAQVTCPAGQYCDVYRLSTPSGSCQEGYYCPAGSTDPRQFICPAGYYCPAGSGSYSACPIGTYGPLTGASSINDCLPCDQGQYCPSAGMTAAGSSCAAGYYCPLSQYQSNPTTSICPKGYFCVAGSVAPSPCTPGTYQPLAGQSSCITCPVGYYCDGTSPAVAMQCPSGYYCPSGTQVASQNPCPIGYYYDKLGGTVSSDCIKCPAGFYCPNKGQVTYSSICVDGYVCYLGAIAPNPTDGTTGKVCPSGYYCPAGIAVEQPCPAGTFYDGTKAFASTECQNVLPGRFSTLTGRTTSNLGSLGSATYNNCNNGYACYGGSYTSTPTTLPMGQACPAGYYCSSGTTYTVLCPIGQYQSQAAQSGCLTCPSGSYCPNTGTITPSDCLSRYYCPLGSKIPTPCPPGTYSTATSLSSTGQCPNCPGGSYCEVPATDTTTNQCAAGFVCQSGSADQMPPLVYNGGGVVNGRCPAGSYCPLGSSSPIPCSIGTYQDAPGNTACKDCPHGYGCTQTGIASLTSSFLCTAGYVCNKKSVTLTPIDGITGIACPSGYYCPTGTPIQQRCADGTYQPLTSQGACAPCPAGKTCYFQKGNSAITYNDCPPYYYCTGGNSYVGNICDIGYTTSSGAVGLKKVADCQPCGAGKYCVDAEKDNNIADPCAAGFYCESGASTPVPPSGVSLYAKPCDPGFYCDMGTPTEIQCPAGKFRGTPGAKSVDECSVCMPGQYCTQGNPVPNTCPPGAYCPLGTNTPISCPLGTYNLATGAAQKYECTSCPAGYLCNQVGISNYDTRLYYCPPSSYCLARALQAINCLAGFYLAGSGRSAADCMPCTAGFYCPQGSTYPIPCDDGMECPGLSPAQIKCSAGYYCRATNLASTPINKTICPAGYFCPSGSKDPLICTEGFVCPEGSIVPLKCPYGSFLIPGVTIQSMKSLDTACFFCGRGYYSGDNTCKPCPAGYICLGKTVTKYPVNITTDRGYECPPGYYCPEMSLVPLPCPNGTYRNTKKAKSIKDCMLCPNNTFNDKIGQPACRKCGPSAFTGIGNTTCTCVGKKREFFKSDSSCRCISGFYQVKYGIKSATDDSALDCEPHVFPTCGFGQIYDHDGKCISKDNCTSQCNGGTGSYSSKYGVCLCDNTKSLNQVCDENCRKNSVKVNITSISVIVYNPTNSSQIVTLSITEASIFMSFDGIDLSKVNDTLKIKSVDTTGSGFSGKYGPSDSLLKYFMNKTNQTNTTSGKRLLADSEAGISTPTVCAVPGESISFGVSKDHYPVYLKNSLINTVIDFDYGAFLTLADQITKAGLNTTVFLYSFTQKGTYAFGDSADNAKQMIIIVQDECSSNYILPMTSENLASQGVSMRDDVITGLPLWSFLVAIGATIGTLILVVVVIRSGCEWTISWTYGKDLVTVTDKKKVGEPDEEEEDEMKRLAKRGEDSVDGLFFVYLKQKLNEMDEKMKELLAKANISSIKKLKKLAEKINKLKEMFNEHVGALIMPNGMTIDEYIRANEDQLAKDSSDYSSVIDESDNKSSESTPREQKDAKKDEDVKPQEEKKEAQDIIAIDQGFKPEGEIDKDIKRDIEKVKDDEKVIKNNINSELQKRKDDFLNMITKYGNKNDAQDLVKDEVTRLAELQAKLNEELDSQNAGLQDKLMKRQEKKLKVLEEVDRIKKEQEESDQKKRNELEKLSEERKGELELVDKETEDEKERGKQLIDKSMNEQLAAQHARFLQQFQESSEKDKLLARHEGETQRLKEHLESEKRKQERELESKLEERAMLKKKEIIDVYKKREDSIGEKYEKITSENDAKRAVIEGVIPASEDDLQKYSSQLNAERERIQKQLVKDAQSDDIVLDANRRRETDAIEKEYQLEERKIYLESRQELDDFTKKQIDNEKALKDKFTKDVKNAPTSKEKSELLAQYDKAKKDLKESFEMERKKMDDKTEERLAERRRNKEKKKIQLDGKLEQDKSEADKKTKQKIYSEMENKTHETVEKLISQAVSQNGHPAMDIPVVFEYLVRSKLNENLSNLKKAQFAELSQQLSSIQSQLMKEKFIEIAAIKDLTEKKAKDFEKKAMAPEKYQKKLERLQKDEIMKIEAISSNYENKSIGQESHIRTTLANQHCDEIIRLIDSEEKDRGKLLDKVLRRHNADGKIPKNVIEELNQKKAQEFNEMRDEAKSDRDKKLQEAQKILGEMNQEDIQEIEKKYAREIEAESKKLDDKLREDKKKAIEDRKRQFEERLAKIPEISIEQRKHLMEEHQRELEKLERVMAEAREAQLKKMKEKLINKKIQQERLRARAEKKTMQKLREAAEEPVVVVEGKKEEIIVRPATRQKVEPKISSFAYKPLLKQWVTKMEDKKSEESKAAAAEKSLAQLSSTEKIVTEEVKEEEHFDENEGAYVNMKELFETVLNCYDLANTVQDFEFPEIARSIEKLTYFMEAILKGGKRLGDANLTRLGMKQEP